MKISFWMSVFCLLACSMAVMAEGVAGFWKTIDEKSGKPESIVAIYEYQGKYYGRIVATYESNGTDIKETMKTAKTRAPGVAGNPFYAGLDLLWDLKQDGTKYTGGKIVDPLKGKIYDAEIWLQNNKLIVRGKLLFFGRSQAWVPAVASDFPAYFQQPDLVSFVPKIPEVTKPAVMEATSAGS